MVSSTPFPLDEWEALLRRHFGFLVDNHGFTFEGVEANGWAITGRYRSTATAIEISYRREFSDTHVEVVRLVNGERPPYPVHPTREQRLHWLDLARLRRVRPGLAYPWRWAKFRSPPVEEELRFWSATLREDFADLLAGDLGVLDQAEAGWREELGPVETTIRLVIPANYSDDEAERLVAAEKARYPWMEVRVEQAGSGRGCSWPFRRRRE